MQKNQELVAYYDKNVIQNGCMYMPFILAAWLYMYYFGIDILWSFIKNILYCFKVNFWLLNDIEYYVLFSLKNLILFFIITFLLAFIYSLFLLKSTSPLLIVNQKGIVTNYFGLIPWSNISEVAPYNSGMPLDAIGIRVKNSALLSAQATIPGKFSIFYSKIFGYPPIIIMNITLTSDEIISFAQQFIGE